MRIELEPSAFLASALLALHAVAGLCALAVLRGPAGVAVAVLLACLGLASAWRHALLRAASSVRALELAGPKLELSLASGDSFPAELAERRYAGRYMVILPLRRPTRRTILVTRDMTDGDSFRRLRIWTLWGRLPVAGEQLPA